MKCLQPYSESGHLWYFSPKIHAGFYAYESFLEQDDVEDAYEDTPEETEFAPVIQLDALFSWRPERCGFIFSTGISLSLSKTEEEFLHTFFIPLQIGFRF